MLVRKAECAAAAAAAAAAAVNRYQVQGCPSEAG